MSIDIIKPFFMGISRNKSITNLDIRIDIDIGEIFTILGPFFENGPLITLNVRECNLGDNGWRLLALAIGSSKRKSLESVLLENSNISDEALVDIITALSMHPRLELINLEGNRLCAKGCIALATLLQNSCTELQTLDLGHNELDDEGIDALVPALKNCSYLQSLDIGHNSGSKSLIYNFCKQVFLPMKYPNHPISYTPSGT